jgi:hypothetical protein
MKQFKNHLVIRLADGTTISVRRARNGYEWREGTSQCWSSHIAGVKDSAETLGGTLVRVPNPNYMAPSKNSNRPAGLAFLLNGGMLK